MWKPMLAPNEIPTDALLSTRLPLLASYKLDGIRCTIQNGRLLSRTLKDIPNELLQERFCGLPEGIDGELVQGIKQDNETFKRSHSIVMSSKPLNFYGDTVRLHVFDKFHPTDEFVERLHEAHKPGVTNHGFVVPVMHTVIRAMSELAVFEEHALSEGYEGVMLRSLDGPYKQGRATLNQGWLMKLKRYVDAEAKILSCYEEMENQNEEFTNELGRTARSSAKDGKVGKNQLGGFNVIGVNGQYKGVEFRVSSSSIPHDERKELWEGRALLEAKLLTYKYFPIGSDEKPRAPVFKGLRNVEDVTYE
jgi:DNA ligase 1